MFRHMRSHTKYLNMIPGASSNHLNIECMYSFRMPSQVDRRRKWDDILFNHRHTHGNLICIEHFKSDDYVVGKNRPILKKDAVPTIFNSSTTDKNLAHDADVANIPISSSDDKEILDIMTVADIIDYDCVTQPNDLVCENCTEVIEKLKQKIESCQETIKNMSEELGAVKKQLNIPIVRYFLNDNFNEPMVIMIVNIFLKNDIH